MQFDLVVPKVKGLNEDAVVESFIENLKTYEKSDWPVNRLKYVTFGDDPTHPQEIGLHNIAGELRDYPHKGFSGKWFVDVRIFDGDMGKKVRLLVPYMKQAGNPMVALMDGIEDMAIPGKVFDLHIKLGQVPPHMK